MSERAFFSLRHSIPGFTFIVLIVSTNLVPIFEKLSGAEVGSGIFIGFLSLLSGPAFGFLISQSWWFVFRWKGGGWWLDPDAFAAFLTKLKKKKPGSRQLKAKLIPVLDYIVQYEGHVKEYHKGNYREYSASREAIFRYLERRWDLFHTLCSELLTLCVGVPLGIFLRIMLFEYPLVNTDFKILLLIISAAVILILLLLSGISRIRSEHNVVSMAIVKGTRLNAKELAHLFPVLNDLETVDDQT